MLWDASPASRPGDYTFDTPILKLQRESGLGCKPGLAHNLDKLGVVGEFVIRIRRGHLGHLWLLPEVKAALALVVNKTALKCEGFTQSTPRYETPKGIFEGV